MTEELAAIFAGKKVLEFDELFKVVHARYLARGSAGGGEEMLRLRMYEKLQKLVLRGFVTKVGRKYQGLVSLASIAKTSPFNEK